MAQDRHVHDHDDVSGLLSVEDARRNVLAQIHPLASLQLPLTEAYGCVIAEDIVAERDLPEFASSAMDGFAVRSSDVAGATPARPIELKIVGSARIGRRPDAVVGGGEAVRIATGAPIPAGADTIVPIENAEPGGEMATIFDGPAAGQHIRPSGEDVKAGQVLVRSGKRLGPPEMGLLANAGFPHPHVHPRPRVIVLSTGDELIPPTETPEFGQVRDSNAYMIFSALRDVGAQPVLAGIVKDDVDALKDTVVKAAFFRRGDVDFYKVAMQPGMPQGFGQIEGKPYFGLPGNPVSVFVSFEIFVRPAILKMMGRTQLYRPEVTATLTDAVDGPRGKLQFARVRLERSGAGWTATPTGHRGSNLISTVVRANGLAMIPVGTATAAAGSDVRVMVFRSSED
jgi:molybdopterin molybdotransferase